MLLIGGPPLPPHCLPSPSNWRCRYICTFGRKEEEEEAHSFWGFYRELHPVLKRGLSSLSALTFSSSLIPSSFFFSFGTACRFLCLASECRRCASPGGGSGVQRCRVLLSGLPRPCLCVKTCVSPGFFFYPCYCCRSCDCRPSSCALATCCAGEGCWLLVCALCERWLVKCYVTWLSVHRGKWGNGGKGRRSERALVG